MNKNEEITDPYSMAYLLPTWELEEEGSVGIFQLKTRNLSSILVCTKHKDVAHLQGLTLGTASFMTIFGSCFFNKHTHRA